MNLSSHQCRCSKPAMFAAMSLYAGPSAGRWFIARGDNAESVPPL